MSNKKPPAPAKELTIREVARMGGMATARARTKAERRAAARHAAMARWHRWREHHANDPANSAA